MTLNYDAAQRKLTVRGAMSFPAEAYDYPEAEIVDMSHGSLRSLPADLGRHFKKLKVAFFSYNLFEEVPNFANCSQLELLGMRGCRINEFGAGVLPRGIRSVVLTENELTAIPSDIGHYEHLQKLFLTGNQLTSLPRELANCTNLEIVRFAVNKLAEPPEWLFHLPRLAWYADSSNPYSPLPHDVPNTYEWHDLTFSAGLLGKSNNNEVRRALLPDGSEVAVKLFGHAIVTDGRPEDDMNACLLAGDNENVVGALGKVVNTPDGRQAMVMKLLNDYSQVAQPPNFQTICRDVYPEGTAFSAGYVLKALKTIAAGAAHLHSRGIQHGDIYGHNTVAKPDGTCRVSDFGAASLYKVGSQEGELRQRLDVLAFGHQMGEFLEYCTELASSVAKELRALQVACEQENVMNRPAFVDINEVLSRI